MHRNTIATTITQTRQDTPELATKTETKHIAKEETAEPMLFADHIRFVKDATQNAIDCTIPANGPITSIWCYFSN